MDAPSLDALLELYRWEFQHETPAVLDWTGTMRVRPQITDPPVRDARPDAPARNTVIFGPAADRLSHPDASVEIVVLDERTAASRMSEARRVARDAVMVWSTDGSAATAWRRPEARPQPQVSVVVTAAGHRSEDVTSCLESIAGHTPVTPAIEVLVLDEAAGARAGDAAAVNLGADRARGALLVSVSADVRVAAGWLRPLVTALRDEPDLAVVGGRLVTDGGQIAAAGGALFSDGSRAGFAAGLADGHDPLYATPRRPAFVGLDLMATRTGLLQRLGGLDGDLPATLAAADYCLRARLTGRDVSYEPRSVAIAGRAPGVPETDAQRRRFVRRWSAALALLPDRPAQLDAAAWARLAGVA